MQLRHGRQCIPPGKSSAEDDQCGLTSDLAERRSRKEAESWTCFASCHRTVRVAASMRCQRLAASSPAYEGLIRLHPMECVRIHRNRDGLRQFRETVVSRNYFACDDLDQQVSGFRRRSAGERWWGRRWRFDDRGADLALHSIGHRRQAARSVPNRLLLPFRVKNSCFLEDLLKNGTVTKLSRSYLLVILLSLGYKKRVDPDAVEDTMKKKTDLYGTQASDRILGPEPVTATFDPTKKQS
ncbi:conserved hypothetical protein [Culex quinquefasciatus]|uniref:Uncharacterized protein n=1 Tax=Culex quinquefasciatus TaxID=7176 RepID=B0WUA9_CULQU|nr:conserved hypothetical protein [Culex quinquefasciatus]|eukprot:XP_001870914.1 conserved hypothetical protein [Culex quinquefasciatus]